MFNKSEEYVEFNTTVPFYEQLRNHEGSIEPTGGIAFMAISSEAL